MHEIHDLLSQPNAIGRSDIATILEKSRGLISNIFQHNKCKLLNHPLIHIKDTQVAIHKSN